MDLKEQANKLIKLAEQIEKEASEYAFFICANCNHTASLKDINARRAKIASMEDPEMTVKPVTVNDKISCPVVECGGTMSYVATDESDKYYVEAGKEDVPEADAPEAPAPEADAPEVDVLDDAGDEKKDTAKKDDGGDIDEQIDSLFEDVETQNEKTKADKKDKVDTIQKARKEKKEKTLEDDSLLDEGEEKDKGDAPKDTAEPPAEEPSAEKDEEVKEPEDKPKPKKKKEPLDLEKKDVPKFKSKEAADRYAQSVSRYSM